MIRYQIRLGKRVLHTSTLKQRAIAWFNLHGPMGAIIVKIHENGGFV